MPIPRIDNLEGVPTVQSAVVFRSIHALMNGGRLTDDDGNKFRVTQFNFAQSNASRAYVTKHTRNNVFVAHWQVPLTDEYKHDFVGLDYSGSDLLVLGTGHDTMDPERLYESCEAVIPGVFVNRGGGLLPGRGGESTPLQVEEGEPVDYARIERAIDAKLAAFMVALEQKFDAHGIAAGLRSKPAEGMAYVTDPANYSDPTAKKYQDALFPFVKNAAANPLANVLGGQDEWGRARQAELEAIIERVVRRVLGKPATGTKEGGK